MDSKHLSDLSRYETDPCQLPDVDGFQLPALLLELALSRIEPLALAAGYRQALHAVMHDPDFDREYYMNRM